MFDAPLEPGPIGNPGQIAMMAPLVVERMENYPCNRQPWLPEPELRRTGCPVLSSPCKHVDEVTSTGKKSISLRVGHQ